MKFSFIWFDNSHGNHLNTPRSNCFHKEGHMADKCHVSNTPYMVIFWCIQLVLSQIPNFHKLSWLSIVAVVMSFAYSFIGLGLSVAVESRLPCKTP
ncbi:unnamed protein product [Linum trigynum]|uniref:Amino acid transporter transmembrane domain-containing protein n=1 Tax=Linum trigynum TaxID=586398 RepID=A0AAV2CZ76_9ROSI